MHFKIIYKIYIFVCERVCACTHTNIYIVHVYNLISEIVSFIYGEMLSELQMKPDFYVAIMPAGSKTEWCCNIQLSLYIHD